MCVCEREKVLTQCCPRVLLLVDLVGVVQNQIHVLIEPLAEVRARASKSERERGGGRERAGACVSPGGRFLDMEDKASGWLALARHVRISAEGPDSATHHDDALNLQIGHLIDPYLHARLALQEPEDQVDRLRHDTLHARRHGEEFFVCAGPPSRKYATQRSSAPREKMRVKWLPWSKRPRARTLLRPTSCRQWMLGELLRVTPGGPAPPGPNFTSHSTSKNQIF